MEKKAGIIDNILSDEIPLYGEFNHGVEKLENGIGEAVRWGGGKMLDAVYDPDDRYADAEYASELATKGALGLGAVGAAGLGARKMMRPKRPGFKLSRFMKRII